jgi:hypothetical protein
MADLSAGLCQGFGMFQSWPRPILGVLVGLSPNRGRMGPLPFNTAANNAEVSATTQKMIPSHMMTTPFTSHDTPAPGPEPVLRMAAQPLLG